MNHYKLQYPCMDLPSFVFVSHFSSQWVTEVGVDQQRWSKKPTFSVYPIYMYIPYFAKIKKTAHFYHFFSDQEMNPRFISFIQEAKNNIHIIIDAWQLHFDSALNFSFLWEN